jgi:hypothetical protein
MYLLSKATSLKTFFTQMLAYYKILRTFASLLKGSTLTKEFWRGGRVVDCGGLENRCTARYPGFESLSLRNKGCKSSNYEIYTLFYTQKAIRVLLQYSLT